MFEVHLWELNMGTGKYDSTWAEDVTRTAQTTAFRRYSIPETNIEAFIDGNPALEELLKSPKAK